LHGWRNMGRVSLPHNPPLTGTGPEPRSAPRRVDGGSSRIPPFPLIAAR
jgi:hypothetical protein